MSKTLHQSTASTAADQQPSPSTNGSNGRDANGRFTKGNAGGAGNPFARQVAALRSAFVRAVSAQDIDDIAMALIIRAKAGDVAAAKLLLAYCIGKPGDTVEPDRLDIDEWKLTQQTAAEPSEFAAGRGSAARYWRWHARHDPRQTAGDGRGRERWAKGETAGGRTVNQRA